MLTPKLIAEGKLGSVISGIQSSGCEINAMESFDINQLNNLRRQMGDNDASKVIRNKVTEGTSIFLEVFHPDGYNKLLEEMLRVEFTHGTGYSHFDKGNERLSDKVFY